MNEVRRLLTFLKPYWKRCLVALVFLTAVVLMDLAIPRLVQRIIDEGITAHSTNVMLQTTLLMLGISLLSALFAIGNNYVSIQVGEGVARDLRSALFLTIQRFSFGNLDRLKTGNLMVRLTSDTGVFQRLVQVSLRIGTRAPLLMAGSLILMIRTSPKLAMMMLPLLIITGVLIVFFVVKMGPLFLSIQQRLDRMNSVLQENIAGVRVIKAFVRHDHESTRFNDANERYVAQNIRVMQFMATMSPALGICVNLGIVVVVWAGGIQSTRGDLTTGQLVAFINYLQTTLHPLVVMVMLANVWAAAISSAGRICEILDVEPEVSDASDAITIDESTPPHLSFKHVHFHYSDSAATDVLDDISFEAFPGETIAILGATGAGKSSLVNLIPRFYDVTGGQILINGVDIRMISHDSLLSIIGIVPQETVLFAGTVRDNIRYGRPTASDPEIVSAARMAEAHDFISQLQDGYDTHIEQRGINLSGGQKQRIAIARALLVQPAILILDDSTSSVDVETERRIQSAIASGMPQQTRLIVAQRISTVRNANRIVLLDKGRIVALGTHRELLDSSIVYKEIYDSQLGNGTLIPNPRPLLGDQT